MKRLFLAFLHFIRYIYIYIVGYIIGHVHYDFDLIKRSKYSKGKRFKSLDAPVWDIIYRDYLYCRKLGVNTDVPWPVSCRCTVTGAHNIEFDPNDLNNFQGFGNYFQAFEKIKIGSGTYIASNVGIITANHDLYNLEYHENGRPVIIGDQCWIGMNSIILPGVVLGTHTIVGAGSVVTKSFPEGNCIIAGVPATKIKDL